jgi:predicted transcriptional regulator
VTEEASSPSLVDLTAEIVASYAANNEVGASELASLIQATYSALSGLGQEPPKAAEPEKAKGAVSVRKSLADDAHIISMIDGKPYKMLRRHLSGHGHTPDSYRETFGLPKDYPMISKAYAAARSALAVTIGLGRKVGTKASGKAKPAAKKGATLSAAKPRGRPPKLTGAAALAKVRSTS